MARLTGIPLRTYLRIERREVQNPGIRHLTNIAIVLGLDPKKGGIAGLYDDDDDPLTWQVFNEDAKDPPAFPERYPGRFLHPDTYEWRSSREAE